MIGVEPENDGSNNFHAMFSVVVQRTGRFASVLIPFKDGPRHCGQLSAWTAVKVVNVSNAAATKVRMSFPSSFFAFVTV
jgi:hypothetical protein